MTITTTKRKKMNMELKAERIPRKQAEVDKAKEETAKEEMETVSDRTGVAQISGRQSISAHNMILII